MSEDTRGAQLAQDVADEFISERQGLDYVTGRYVKQRLNEVFGWDGWSYTIDSFEHACPENNGRAKCALSLVVFTDRGLVRRAGVAQGYGNLVDREGNAVSVDRANQVLDFADAEAVTDALKRAAVSLGQNLGLSLYPMTPGGARKKRAAGGGARRKVKRS